MSKKMLAGLITRSLKAVAYITGLIVLPGWRGMMADIDLAGYRDIIKINAADHRQHFTRARTQRHRREALLMSYFVLTLAIVSADDLLGQILHGQIQRGKNVQARRAGCTPRRVPHIERLDRHIAQNAAPALAESRYCCLKVIYSTRIGLIGRRLA